MINFEKLETDIDNSVIQYRLAKPFEHLVLDGYIDNVKLLKMYSEIPELTTKSRDFIFANEKYEKSKYYELGREFSELYEDLRSDRFNNFLSKLSGKETFVDPKNHGGGLHQGKQNSKLDMHLDYNYHPNHPNWWCEMNILLYLNLGWKPEYGGNLDLVDLRTLDKSSIEVPFNRMIIQKCDNYTLHGYKETNFPEGVYRTSIATYAFTVHENVLYKPRTTDWFVDEKESKFKRFLGRNVSSFIGLKNKILRSGTSKN